MIAAKKLLKQFNLKATPTRILVLSVFLQQQNLAIREKDLKIQLGSNFDRITLYRTLETFLKKKIIHKVVVDKRNTLYALNFDENINEKRRYHAHFSCKVCQQCYCVPIETNTDFINLYHLQVQEIEIFLKGKCEKCQNHKIK